MFIILKQSYLPNYVNHVIIILLKIILKEKVLTEDYIMFFQKKQSIIKLNGATPMKNGIKFHSSRHKGYYCEVTIDEEGCIIAKWISDKKEDKKAFSYKDLLYILFSALAFFLGAIIIILLVQDFFIFLRLFWLVISFGFLFIYYKQVSEATKNGNNYFKFHSAANMGLNAFQKLNRPPTFEELRDYSHYSSKSSSAGIAFISIHHILLFAATFFPAVIGIILLLIEYPSLIILQKKGKLNFLQKFDTQDPTDVELDVAAFGIEVWYENEIKDDK